MPPEVRNQIYGYVLGGNEIHVRIVAKTQNARIKNRKLQVFICTADLDEGSAATMIRRHSGHDFSNLSDWYRRHEQCGVVRYINTSSIPTPIYFHGLNLLGTCAQIHSEAALLPFQTNTFIFDSKISFHTFCKKLVAVQLQAVTTISLEAEVFYRFEEKLATVRDMTALQRVTIFYPMPRLLNATLDQHIQKRLHRNLKAWSTPFKSLKLSSVRICFYPEVSDTGTHRDGRRYTLGPSSAAPERLKAHFTRYNEVCEEIEGLLIEKGGEEHEDGDGSKT